MKSLFRSLLLITLFIIVNCIGQKINLRLDIKQGTKYKSRITADQKISQTIQNQQIEMDQTIIMEFSYDVIDVNKAGNMIVKITYDEIGYIIDGPMGKVAYKSWEDPDSVPLMAKGFVGLLGQSLTMEITSRGKIINVSGTDKIIDNMLEDFDLPIDDEMKEQMEENMKNQFGDDAMNEMMQKMFAIYPEEPVGIGDSWHAKFVFTKGFPMILNNTWKLREIKNGKMYIDIYSKIEPNKDAKLMQMGGVEISYELSGEQKGYIIVDTLTGWLIGSKIDQEFEGKISTSGSMYGMEQDIEMPISTSGSIIIETIEE